MADPNNPSISQVNRAGKTLRKYLVENEPTADQLHEVSVALDVLVAWRRTHATPLQSATMGLRSRVATAKCEGEVSQRLKRIPTILDKMTREPQMALSRMADIGGCRAILGDIAEVRRVQKRFEGGGNTVRIRDYIDEPKASGYRGVHVIVEYSTRKIEVQLRTRVMHEWAYMVEMVSTRTGLDVKSGKGPVAVQTWFHAVSEAMAIEERGLTVDEILASRIAMLREQAGPHLRGATQ